MQKLLIPLFFGFLAFSQDKRPVPFAAPVEPVSTNLPAQMIGADDMIMLSVYNSPEFTRTVRVGPDGEIRIPMLKQKIKAKGLMPAQLEVSVADALKQEQLLVDPFVTVTMVEYHSRRISVLGAVRSPISFQAIGDVTLVEALTRAGGLTDEAEGEVLISRPGADRKTNLVQRIPIKQLIDNNDPELNMKLEGGEEIRVPEAPKIVVTGNVKKPGAFSVKDSSEMTVLKAIALSEGLSQFAGDLAYLYRPDDSKNTKNEIVIPLKKILTRKAADIALQPRDMLYIPDSTGKRTLDRALTLGGGIATGLAIFH